jgi:hypothetical protein
VKASLTFFTMLVLGLCIFCPQARGACDEVPAGQTLLVRLVQPVYSYSAKPGTVVRGILIAGPNCEGGSVFPEGAIVEGQVKSVHRVGLGFRHEVASLEIEFTRILLPGTPAIPIDARVVNVDNAREKLKDGVIHGIRSNNSPQDHLTSRLEYVAMWSPSLFWVVPAYKTALPFAPEAEIRFPAGTDLLLKTVSPVAVSGMPPVAPVKAGFAVSQEEELDSRAELLTHRTANLEGQSADLVNVVLLGTREQVMSAFTAAGWVTSDPLSPRIAFREIGAFMFERTYLRGPMSTQTLDGKPQDLKLEKSLDTIARRDHLRLWSQPATWLGQPAWFGASTQDVGGSLSLRSARFQHHVKGNIDEERGKVVRDLSLAGCVAAVHDAPRPDAPQSFTNSAGDEIRTDGTVAIVQLQDCVRPPLANETPAVEGPSRPPRVARYFRTQILALRDVWRENAAYGAFDIGRATVRAIRRKHEAAVLARKSPSGGPVAEGAITGSAFLSP